MATLTIISGNKRGDISKAYQTVDDRDSALQWLVQWFTDRTLGALTQGDSAPIMGYVRDFLHDWNTHQDPHTFDRIYNRFSGGADRIIFSA